MTVRRHGTGRLGGVPREDIDPAATDGPYAKLVAALDMSDPGGDVQDEHVRWVVYQAAIESPEHWPLLLRALEAEPMISLSVALLMLERVSDTEGTEWLAAIPADDLEYASARARDLATARTFLREDATADPTALNAWPDWVQRYVVERTQSEPLLTAMEQHGRTRRVRGVARERLIGRRRAPERAQPNP